MKKRHYCSKAGHVIDSSRLRISNKGNDEFWSYRFEQRYFANLSWEIQIKSSSRQKPKISFHQVASLIFAEDTKTYTKNSLARIAKFEMTSNSGSAAAGKNHTINSDSKASHDVNHSL